MSNLFDVADVVNGNGEMVRWSPTTSPTGIPLSN